MNLQKKAYLFGLILAMITTNFQLCAINPDSLRKEITLVKNDPLQQVTLNLELCHHFFYSNSDSILYYLNQAKKCAQDIEYLPHKTELELIQNEAYYHYVIHKNREAIILCNRLINKALEYKDFDKLSFGYNNLSGNYDDLGLKDSMDWAIDTAIFIAESHNIEKNLAVFYQNKANDLTNEERYAEGIECYLKAIEMHEKNDGHEETGLIFYSLGLTFSSLKDYDSANRYFNLAIDVHTKEENWLELIRCFNGQAVAFKNNNEYTKAIDGFQRAIKIGEPKNMKGELLQVYYNLGNTFSAIGEYEKAKSVLIEGMNFCKSIGLEIGQKFYAFGLANLYTKMADRGKAKEYIEMFEGFAPVSSLTLAEKLEYFELKSKYFELLKDYNLALSFEKKARMVSDSLGKIQQDESILSLEKKYSKAKVESENNILKKTNLLTQQEIKNRNLQILWLGALALLVSISLFIVFIGFRNNKRLNKDLKNQKLKLDELNKSIQQKNLELEQTIEDKEKILYQVSHDFKNQMTSIFGVSELLKEESIPDHIKSHIDIIHEASEDTVEIIDELLETSKKNWVLKNQEIDFEKMVRGIEKGFSPQLINKDLKFQLSASPNFKFQSNKVIVSRILQNLIANSIKYSDNNGIITITAEKTNKNVILSVIDTGKGFSEEQKTRAFNMRMIEQEIQVESYGFGLLIVKELVDKIGAEVELESTVDKGSKISIIL